MKTAFNFNRVHVFMALTPFIGLEVHVQPKTKSKMFCSCSADFFGKEPNINTCPVCLGLPGALPVPNKKAIEMTIKLGLALNCTIQKNSFFERKNYFYPDLPKGYQISQYKKPLCINGWVEVGNEKIHINRVHQEEDTAKLSYHTKLGLPAAPTQAVKEKITKIDFNRSGIPLTEIVSEPDIHSTEQAVSYLKKLQQIIRTIDFSDADMEKGSMRLEANISLSKNGKLPNYRVELKNINSFRFVKKALDHEIKRQTEILEPGRALSQETRGFNEKTGKTFAQRTKEEAHDYRYFPEPDIPVLEISDDWINKIKKELPELPGKKIERLTNQYQIPANQAKLLVKLKLDEKFVDIINALQGNQTKIPKVLNLLINRPQTRAMSTEEIRQLITGPQDLISNEALVEVVKKIIADNPKAVGDYKKGKETVIKFLIGQVMREVRGKAEAKKIEIILQEKLEH